MSLIDITESGPRSAFRVQSPSPAWPIELEEDEEDEEKGKKDGEEDSDDDNEKMEQTDRVLLGEGQEAEDVEMEEGPWFFR